MKPISTHVATAKAIRQDLKKAYPLTKFQVCSDSFTGGTSVAIEWLDGPTSDMVKELVDKYQYGHFDSMQDIYVSYSNQIKGLPQVKYVQVRREISIDTQSKMFEHCKNTYGDFDEITDIHRYDERLQMSASNYIYRLLSRLDLTNGLNIEVLCSH